MYAEFEIKNEGVGRSFVDVENLSYGRGEFNANNVNMASTVRRDYTSTGYNDVVVGQSEVVFTGPLAVTTQENQQFIATNVKAANLALEAGGSVSADSLQLSSHHETGRRDKDFTSESHTWHVGSNFATGGNLSVTAAGNVGLYASHVKVGGDARIAAGGVLEIAAGVNASEYEARQTTSSKNDLGMKKTKTTNSYVYTEVLSGGVLDVKGHSTLEGGQAVKTEGAQFRAGGGTLVEGGEVEFLAKKTNNIDATSSKYKDPVIQGYSTHSRTIENANGTEFVGGVTFGEVTGGIKAEIDLTKASGQVLLDATKGRKDLTFTQVSDHEERHDKRRMQLTPEATAVVMAAASLATAGVAGTASSAIVGTSATTAGATAGATTTQIIASAGIKAAITSAASQLYS